MGVSRYDRGMDGGGSARLAALETKVSGIESSVQSVGTAVQGLADKLDRRSATPWPVIWSAAGVTITFLTVVGGLAYSPILAGQTRLEIAHHALLEKVVTRAEHEGRWREQDRMGELLRERIGRVETRNSRRFERLEEPYFRGSNRARD